MSEGSDTIGNRIVEPTTRSPDDFGPVVRSPCGDLVVVADHVDGQAPRRSNDGFGGGSGKTRPSRRIEVVAESSLGGVERLDRDQYPRTHVPKATAHRVVVG